MLEWAICKQLGGSILADSVSQKPKERNSYATAALIGSIIAILNLCIFSFTTAIVLGVGSVSFALISKKDRKISKPARLAVFLGVGAIVFGVIEYFYMMKILEMAKDPEYIIQFNQLYREIEKFLIRK